ncbi:MAG TPA: phage holin family protein [Phycisphaerae bacterium]|nr:phage holin family protein [Phycisphaerae bacterium]
MVASTSDPGATSASAHPHDPHASPNPGAHNRPKSAVRGGLRRLLGNITRLISIQLQIWLTQAKATALKIALFAGLFAAAAVLAILAIIFLYIGVFHLLTDVAGLRPVWAFLIYGGFHLLLALILILVAVKILGRKNEDDEHDEDDHDAPASHTPEHQEGK